MQTVADRDFPIALDHRQSLHCGKGGPFAPVRFYT